MLAAVTAAAELAPPVAAGTADEKAAAQLARRGRHSDPVVQHFSIVSDRSSGSNLKLKCLFCNKEFKGSATRMRAHLAGSKDGVAACPNVPEDVKATCTSELQAKRDAKARLSSLPGADGTPVATDAEGKPVASAAVASAHSKAEWEFLEKHYLVLGCSSAGNRSLRCHHCGKEFKGSATRMRAHLAGSRDGVAPCPLAPPDVQAACLEAVKGRQTAKALQTRALEDSNTDPASAKKQKTEGTPGSKGRQSDPVVKHFQIMSDRSARSNLSLKCLYCQKEFKGSATRMRGHLAGSRDGVSACSAVPESVRAEFLSEVKDKQSFKARLAQQMAEVQANPALPGGADAPPPVAATGPGSHSATKNEGLDKHFEVIGVATNGNRSLRCIHCSKTFQGSATRMRAHLAGSRNGISACPSVPQDVKDACLKVITTKRAAGVLQPEQQDPAPPVPMQPLTMDGINNVPAPLSIDSLGGAPNMGEMPLPF